MNKESPPRPNLKEIQQFVKDLRDPVNQEYGGFNARAADLIDSLLSEGDEARNNALEEAAKVADDYIDTLTRRGMSERPAFEIAQALRAMRGKRTARLNDMKVGDEIEWKDGAP